MGQQSWHSLYLWYVSFSLGLNANHYHVFMRNWRGGQFRMRLQRLLQLEMATRECPESTLCVHTA